MITVGGAALALVLALVVSYVAASPTFGWTGRSLSLLDPTYASKYIPIIASVSGERHKLWWWRWRCGESGGGMRRGQMLLRVVVDVEVV